MNNEKENQINTLIADAQNGDEIAKEILIEMHRAMIWSLANRMQCERATRQELVQAGYLGFMRALVRYDPAMDAKLITYALPWILGEMRRAMRWKESEIYSLDEPLDGEHLTLYDMLEGEPGVDINRLDLHLALSKLSRDEQLLLCLRYFRDKTQKEAAVILGKSQTQISRMERHALDSLHAMLG